MSFATENRRTAESAVQALESNGYKCWVAWRDIPESVPYAAAIVQGIRGAQVLLLLLTPDSRSSPHVLREVECAVAANRPILSVQMAGCLPGEALAYYLGPTQWLRNDQTELAAGPLLDAVSKLVKDAALDNKAVSGSRALLARLQSALRFPIAVLWATGVALITITEVLALFLGDQHDTLERESILVAQIRAAQHRSILLVIVACILSAGYFLEDVIERRRAPFNPLHGQLVPSYAVVAGLFLIVGIGVWSFITGLSPAYLVTGSSPGLNYSIGSGIPHFLTGFGGEVQFWLEIRTIFSPGPYGWTGTQLGALLTLLATALVLGSIALCVQGFVRSPALAISIIAILPFLLVRWFTNDVGSDHGPALIYRACPICAVVLALWFRSVIQRRWPLSALSRSKRSTPS